MIYYSRVDDQGSDGRCPLSPLSLSGDTGKDSRGDHYNNRLPISHDRGRGVNAVHGGLYDGDFTLPVTSSPHRAPRKP